MAMSGFLNLNKAAGFTSHDCVARVRRLLHTKRVGHGGTLDPAAIGVLPIAVGKATRLLQYLPLGKAYHAKIRFGVTTTTDDLEGEILTQVPAPDLSLEQVQSHLPQFIGQIEQIPPRFSAIQVGGRRLYDLARAGESVEVPVRVVKVDQIEILHWHPGTLPELEIAITCGAGTYIRSIARDLGALLGVGGTLAALTRTASSGFLLQDSLTLETLTEQVEAAALHLTPPTVALAHLPYLSLSDGLCQRWQQGQRLSGTDLSQAGERPEPEVYRVQQTDGQFLGIGQVVATEGDDRLLIPKLVWSEEG